MNKKQSKRFLTPQLNDDPFENFLLTEIKSHNKMIVTTHSSIFASFQSGLNFALKEYRKKKYRWDISNQTESTEHLKNIIRLLKADNCSNDEKIHFLEVYVHKNLTDMGWTDDDIKHDKPELDQLLAELYALEKSGIL